MKPSVNQPAQKEVLSMADPSEYSNPLQADLENTIIDMRTWPDWMEVTEIEIKTETGDVLIHWRVDDD